MFSDNENLKKSVENNGIVVSEEHKYFSGVIDYSSLYPTWFTGRKSGKRNPSKKYKGGYAKGKV